MALTLSGTNGIVGAGFTVDPSGASVTSGIGTFSKIAVGANNVNPTQALEVKGSSSVAIQVESSAAQYSEVQINNSTRNYTVGVRPDISHGFAIRDASAGANRLTIDTSGNATVTSGNLVIGTAGKGIDFSATSDSSGTMSSELLDDYEEGTWTPVLTFGGGSTGITYSNRGGNYTKIGRQVTLNFMIELSSKGSSTGDAVVGGLPYTIADLLSGTVIEASGASSYWNNIEPDLMFLAFSASTSSNQLTPRFQPETGASDAVDSLSNSEFTNSTNFRGSITFFV